MTDEQLLFDAEDTYELMRSIEDVTAPVIAGGQDSADNLVMLGRLSKAGAQRQASQSSNVNVKVALAQMRIARQALARNLARSFQ